MWLRSRERTAALQRESYTCEKCGIKQSKAKGREVSVNVHHKTPIAEITEEVMQIIYDRILVDPDELQVLCKNCHIKEHAGI